MRSDYDHVIQQQPVLEAENREQSTFYREVMMWLVASFGVAGFGTYFLGPLVPQSMMMPLYMLLLVSMIVASFLRKTAKGSGILTIVYALGLGVILYPTLNYYVATGSGNIVIMALLGTGVVFGTTALFAWNSEKSLERFAPKLFAVVLGIIATSLLNVFFFHLEWVQMLVAWAALAAFTLYSFIDIQRTRDRVGNMPPSFYALSIFLDIYNIFVSLLQILGGNRN